MFYKNELGNVYYEVHGPENAPAVVFSHGVAMDHRTFESQVEALKDNFRVIVWDMPYHGKSSAIDKKLPFSKTAADFIMEILDTLNIHKAVMAGLSLGSLVVQQAAYKYPDRVAAAIHISGGPLYPRYPAVLKIFKPFMGLMNLYPTTMLNKTFARHKSITEETRAYLMETMSRAGKDTVIHLTKEMLQDMVDGLPEHPKQPALIVYGDHDLGMLKKMSIKWHAGLPGSKLEMVENAHHIANQDNPEEMNRLLVNFLEGI